MIDSETLEKLQNSSVAEQIAIIEMILRTLKTDVDTSLQPSSTEHSQRPDFGFMKDTGKILGDIITPILPDWGG